jgi:4'-phosphopantetheinyl transferase
MNLHWPTTDSPPPLEAGAVHLWAVKLSDASLSRQDVEQVLTAEERNRARRFLREESGRSFAVGRAALRSILAGYLEIPPADVPIENAPNGKPQLTGSIVSDLRFNLAHSGELALIAITRSGEIGVDVERLRPVDHWHEIASRYFHATDTATIGADAAQTPVNFFRCWTRKEAVLKAIGIGIIFPLDLFQVPLEESTHNWISVPAHSSNTATRYWLESLDPCGEYIAAVATTHEISQTICFTYQS